MVSFKQKFKKHISFASTETAAKLFEYFLTIFFKSEINEEVYRSNIKLQC